MTDPTIQGAEVSGGVDFADDLDSRVRAHIEELTEAHAVDEANGDVLDSFIDAAVAEHIEHLTARAMRHEKVLQQELAALTAQRDRVEQAEQDARLRVSAQAQHVLELRASITGPTGPDAADAGNAEIAPERLRAFAVSRRRLLEGEQASAAGRPFRRSVGRLRMRMESAERRAKARARVIPDREARLAEAEARLAEALRRFQGNPAAEMGGSRASA